MSLPANKISGNACSPSKGGCLNILPLLASLTTGFLICILHPGAQRYSACLEIKGLRGRASPMSTVGFTL